MNTVTSRRNRNHRQNPSSTSAAALYRTAYSSRSSAALWSRSLAPLVGTSVAGTAHVT